MSPEARSTLSVAGGLTLVRWVALFSTKLELHPAEAQAWLWSRRPDWGDFSGAPLVHWAIWLTTRLGGDAEPWVRASAPLFQFAATLVVARIGRRLHSPAVGFAAAALYALNPVIQASSLMIGPGAPLALGFALALLAAVEWRLAAAGRARVLWAAGLVASLGLMALSKPALLGGAASFDLPALGGLLMGGIWVFGPMALALWLAARLTRPRARAWMVGAVVLQAVIAAVILATVVNAAFAARIGAAGAFAQAKGWDTTVQAILDRARHDRSLTAIAVNDRSLFNAASYYGRDFLGSPGAPPLRLWLREASPHSRADAGDSLTPSLGGRVLAASLDKRFLDEMTADFRASSDREITSVWLDRDRRRRTVTFIGQDFQPRPRGPVSGRPTPP